MYLGKMMLVGAALGIASLTPQSAAAEEAAASCVDAYLACLNVATQETGDFWRTLKEMECGVDYYVCMRTKLTGA